MHKIQKYLYIFTPTGAGMVVYVFLAGIVMILNQFSMIKQYLEVPQNVELGRIIAGWVDSALTTVIGQSRTETLVVGLFWAFVGLAVYALLNGIAKLMTDLSENMDARSYVWPKGTDRNQPIRILIEQIAFRVAAGLALVWVIFVQVAAILRGPVFVEYIGSDQIMQYVVWFLMSVLTWHIVVILLRLVTLRGRLLG